MSYSIFTTVRGAVLQWQKDDFPITASELSRQIGCSRQRIQQIVKKLGIEVPHKKQRENRKRQLEAILEDYRAANITAEQAAREFGIEAASMFDKAKRDGLIDSILKLKQEHKLNVLKKQSFGFWQVLGLADKDDERTRFHDRHALCQCKCGIQRPVRIHNLVEGMTNGCQKCTAANRISFPWRRDDGEVLATTAAAARDAGVSHLTLSRFVRRNPGKAYVTATNVTYRPLLHQAKKHKAARLSK